MFGNQLKSALHSCKPTARHHASVTFIGKIFLTGIFGIILSCQTFAQTPQIQITGSQQSVILAENIDFLVDKTNQLTADKALASTEFKRSTNQIPVFKDDVQNTWFRFDVTNQSASSSLYLDIAYSKIGRAHV